MAATTFKQIANNRSAQLLNAMAIADASATLATGMGAQFPSSFPYYVSCDYEVILVTGRIGDVLTITRGQDGTNAAIHNKGSIIEMRANAGLWLDLATAINALETGANSAGHAVLADTATLAASATVANNVIDGAITNSKVAGAAGIASSKLGGYPWHNIDLSTDAPRLSRLVNGSFEFFQRITAPGGAGTGYFADYWIARNQGGTSTFAQTKDISNQHSGTSSLKLVYTHGTLSSYVSQDFRTPDVEWLRGRTITLSVWIKASVANAVRAAISTDGATTWTYGNYHTGSGNYEQLTVTITVPLNATDVRVATAYLTASCTIYCDDAMLVDGSQYADYAPLHPADDLARCLRYYLVSNISNSFLTQFYGTAGMSIYQYMPFPAVMAVSPTVTKVGTFSVANSGQPSIYGGDPHGFSYLYAATGAGAALIQGSGSAYFTAEANP